MVIEIGMVVVCDGWESLRKRQERTSGVMETYTLIQGVDYLRVYVFQNLWNFTLKMCAFHYM